MTASSRAMVALVVAALGFFWFAIAPHVVVRHWDGDFGVTCRQLLNGRAQWNDPRVRVWVDDTGPGPSRC